MFKPIYLIAFCSTLSIAQLSFAQDLDVQANVSKHAYSTSVSQRPFTLPAGVGEVGGKIKLSSDKNAVALDFVHLSLGVTNDLQLGLSWGGIQFPALSPATSLNVSAGYSLFANDWIASMASLEVPFHFEDQNIRNVSFAMPTVFPIIKGLSIVGFYDSLLNFQFHDRIYKVSVNLPIAVAYQATQNFALDVSTRIAKFDIGALMNQTYIWDSLPVRVKALYAFTNAFDIVGTVGFADAFSPKDTFSVTLGAQFRIGDLNG